MPDTFLWQKSTITLQHRVRYHHQLLFSEITFKKKKSIILPPCEKYTTKKSECQLGELTISFFV